MLSKIHFFTLFLSPLILFGAPLIDPFPIGSIEGQRSLLNRPEGIAFSPHGDYVAIANAEGNQVLFFRISDCYTQTDQIAPVFVLETPSSSSDYPHDIDFSPDGTHLAVACLHTNRLMIYKRNVENGFYDREPFFVVEGQSASLGGINAVKYNPQGNCLAVCDVRGNQIALFQYRDEQYDPLPYQVLQGPPDVLNRPDGLAFSKDGKLLAVTSHGVHLLLIYERSPDSQIFYHPNVAEILRADSFYFPHSVCFNPLDDTLIVSNAGGRKTLSTFEKLSDAVPRFSLIPSQTFEIYNPATVHLQQNAPEEGGVKGIALSADGKILGLCASDIANPNRTILFYSFVEPRP